MSPHTEHRHYPRVPVQWPVVFYTSKCFGHGTVVDVSPLAWRIRAALPVQAGIQLGIRVWPQQATYLEIEEATVLWARGGEFAVELHRVRPQDKQDMQKLQEQTVGLSPCDQKAKHERQRELVNVSSKSDRGGLLLEDETRSDIS